MAEATERLGVAEVTKFFGRVGWFFREQHVHDWGIDGHVEIVRDGRPTGELIAMQIKSGASFFRGEDEKNVTFRPEAKHVEYWLKHSMPVIVVLYNPEMDVAYWERIAEETLTRTKKGFKVLVPKSQSFESPKRTCRRLSELVQPEPYIRRLNRLRLDKPWMERVQSGETIRVTFDDWVNKSLPRYELQLHVEEEWVSFPMRYMPGIGIEAMLKLLLPWADVSLDEEAHRTGAEEQWENACYWYHDKETGETYYRQSFESWYEKPTEVMVPVSSDGEVESYSLILSLNELGEAFLVADEFLSVPPADEPRTFTFEEALGGSARR